MNYKIFLRWWLIFLLICLGLVIMGRFDIWQMLYVSDISRLSFVIISFFLLFTLYTGFLTLKISREKGNIFDRGKISKRADLPHWIAMRFTMLGILGTGIGIAYMIYTTDFTAETKDVIPLVLQGLGTALLTTITGIVCCLLLELQLFNLTQEADRAKA